MFKLVRISKCFVFVLPIIVGHIPTAMSASCDSGVVRKHLMSSIINDKARDGLPSMVMGRMAIELLTAELLDKLGLSAVKKETNEILAENQNLFILDERLNMFKCESGNSDERTSDGAMLINNACQKAISIRKNMIGEFWYLEDLSLFIKDLENNFSWIGPVGLKSARLIKLKSQYMRFFHRLQNAWLRYDAIQEKADRIIANEVRVAMKSALVSISSVRTITKNRETGNVSCVANIKLTTSLAWASNDYSYKVFNTSDGPYIEFD